MGSGSSKDKDKDTSQANNLRTRSRQPDFEEDIYEDDKPYPERIATSRPLRRSNSIQSNTEDEYFSKFHKKQSSAKDGPQPRGHNHPVSESKVKDPEVEAAIAELEETFRVLDVNSTSSTDEDLQVRSQSCGPLSVDNNNEETESGQYFLQQRDNPRYVPNKGGNLREVSQNGQIGESGRRQRVGTEGQNHLYTRRLHPAGLTHLPRGQAMSTTDGGANSAPPGVYNSRDRSDSEDWNYQLPKIEGFDIEKFRAVNGPKSTPPISIRLSSEEDEDFLGGRSKGPSYTKDEMELFTKLEREVY